MRLPWPGGIKEKKKNLTTQEISLKKKYLKISQLNFINMYWKNCWIKILFWRILGK